MFLFCPVVSDCSIGHIFEGLSRLIGKIRIPLCLLLAGMDHYYVLANSLYQATSTNHSIASNGVWPWDPNWFKEKLARTIAFRCQSNRSVQIHEHLHLVPTKKKDMYGSTVDQEKNKNRIIDIHPLGIRYESTINPITSIKLSMPRWSRLSGRFTRDEMEDDETFFGMWSLATKMWVL